ncbi:hypothetical protein, partial [Aminobacter aminovorans]|uniref:hypothetical protein n=2 Tax=Aminobacter aminovorans TaxID=83263 RepID=UPI0031ED440D
CLGCFGIWTQVTGELNLHQGPARRQSRRRGTKSQILSPQPTTKARQGENHGGLFAVWILTTVEVKQQQQPASATQEAKAHHAPQKPKQQNQNQTQKPAKVKTIAGFFVSARSPPIEPKPKQNSGARPQMPPHHQLAGIHQPTLHAKT